MSKPYTTSDIEYMLSNHGRLTNQQIADRLGRTKESVASRVWQLKNRYDTNKRRTNANKERKDE